MTYNLHKGALSLMTKNDKLKAKDELLNYYERLISRLLQRIGVITPKYDDDTKSKLVATIALDFANANNQDIDFIPGFALQYVRCKRLEEPDDFDADRYSAHEDGFNFLTYCCDLSQVIGYTDGNGTTQIDRKAYDILSKLYKENGGWTPDHRKIKNSIKNTL